MSGPSGIALAAVSELCAVGQKCLNHEEVSYPGGMFFIDPSGMSQLQLLFVFLVYGYVLFISADMIGDGAELLLLIPGYADMVGSIVLPVLGAIPDGMMVLFSGIGPIEVAQEQVAVGVGALAGSTIMLLTLPWVLSVYAGLVDMNDAGECVGYKQPAGKRFKSGHGGIQFQDGVTKNAWLMFLTSLSYFVIQIPAYMVDDQKTRDMYKDEAAYIAEVEKESTSENTWALVGFFITLFFFFFYLYLQYLAAMKKTPPLSCLKALLPPQPPPIDIQKIKKHGCLPLIVYYRENFQKTGKMRVTEAEQATPYAASLIVPLPQDLATALKTFYQEYAGKTPQAGLHCNDMRQLLAELGLIFTPNEFAQKFKAADKDEGGSLDQGEFLSFFYDIVTGKEPLPHQRAAEVPAESPAASGDDDDDDEEIPDEFKNLSPEEQRKQIMNLSCKQMLIGTLLVLMFSDPMVDVLAQIGKMTGVKPFYVSFVLAPLASNASELVSSFKLASKKTSTAITQSLQTLEGAACMNNTFCLGIFFLLIYCQGLAWKFTAETLSIFFSQFLVFLIVIKSKTQSMKTAYMIFGFYPVSLVFVALLEAAGLD